MFSSKSRLTVCDLMDCGHQASLPFTAAQVHMSRTALVAQTVESACSGGDLVPSLGWEEPLEEGMATGFRTLA